MSHWVVGHVTCVSAIINQTIYFGHTHVNIYIYAPSPQKHSDSEIMNIYFLPVHHIYSKSKGEKERRSMEEEPEEKTRQTEGAIALLDRIL